MNELMDELEGQLFAMIADWANEEAVSFAATARPGKMLEAWCAKMRVLVDA
jgi:hypothetical protein